MNKSLQKVFKKNGILEDQIFITDTLPAVKFNFVKTWCKLVLLFKNVAKNMLLLVFLRHIFLKSEP